MRLVRGEDSGRKQKAIYIYTVMLYYAERRVLFSFTQVLS